MFREYTTWADLLIRICGLGVAFVGLAFLGARWRYLGFTVLLSGIAVALYGDVLLWWLAHSAVKP